MNLGPTELIILLVIVLLLFGAKKLPELSRSIGTSIKEFRNATEDASSDGGANGNPDRPTVSAPDGKE